MLKKLSGAVLALALAAMLPTPAQAKPATATAACAIQAGSVTSAGNLKWQGLQATTPPITYTQRTTALGLFQPGQVRLAGPLDFDGGDSDVPLTQVANVVIGSSMYNVQFLVNREDDKAVQVQSQRIGSGWDRFVAFEQSTRRRYQYALRDDGTLMRWSVKNDIHNLQTWTALGSAPGFGSVKTMTLISETATYDTLLANTRGGALYTVRIPVAKTMKPVVTKVRTSTWQGFERLLTARCGQYGTLLLGIDKDNGAGYLYAVGHATGATTVIKALGKVPSTFTDPVDARALWADTPALNGE
ncbi:hypothetical protein AB0L70_17310 [Kribbella sp. NPDC051952]|uniref:hypothetical protein n=1 Tax=Kribbella sp. NPDC051952 TaxID=3154851 RepID=UPI00341C0448